MTSRDGRTGGEAKLRRQAEKIAKWKTIQAPETTGSPSVDESGRLIQELQLHQIELEMQNDELRRAEKELDAERERYFDLYDLSPVGYCTLNEKGLILEINITAATFLGVAKGAMVKQPLTRFILPEDQDIYYRHCKKLFENDELQTCELRMVKKDGTTFWVHLIASAAQDVKGRPVRRTVISNIDERKQAEGRQNLMTEILGIINESPLLVETIKGILISIKREMSFDAVGIRLKSGDDFPYFVYDGFSDNFLIRENTLIVHGQDGSVCRDGNGNISLECICGLVISGRTDPSNLLFTAGGSFWTNDSITQLDFLLAQGQRFHHRNGCIHEGFRSAALIPIRVNQENVGLLQLNCRRKNCFTLDTIRYFEGLASSVGIALTRKQAEEALQLAHDELEQRVASRTEELLRSEENFRRSMDESPLGVRVVTPEGETMYANRAIIDIYGYDTIEELKTTPTEKRYTPESYAEFLIRRKKRRQGLDEAFEYPLSIVRKDGEVRHLQVLRKIILWNGTRQYQVIYTDITERKRMEEALLAKSQQLEQTNTALRVLLRQREEDLKEMGQRIVANVQKLILPYVKEIRKLRLTPSQSNYLDIIDSNLQHVVSPFLQNLAAFFTAFTPREIQIANLIMEGKTSKEIAEFIGTAPRSVELHRNNIRKKLGLGGKKANLRSFLLTLS